MMLQPFKNARYLERLVKPVAFLVLCVTSASQLLAQGVGTEYSVEQIMRALRGGTTSTRVIALVAEGCVSGEVTNAALADLRLAGATEGLINVVNDRRCSRRVRSEPTPKDAGFGGTYKVVVQSSDVGKDCSSDAIGELASNWTVAHVPGNTRATLSVGPTWREDNAGDWRIPLSVVGDSVSKGSKKVSYNVGVGAVSLEIEVEMVFLGSDRFTALVRQRVYRRALISRAACVLEARIAGQR
jgi:hypothetical protein